MIRICKPNGDHFQYDKHDKTINEERGHGLILRKTRKGVWEGLEGEKERENYANMLKILK